MSTSFRFDPVTETPELRDLRAEVRGFLRDEIKAGTFKPGSGNMNANFNPEFSRKLGGKGWLGMTWPKKYGGHERTYMERYVVTEEMLGHGAPVRAHWVADRQSGPVLLHYAQEHVKAKVVPMIARGEAYFCIGLSEPNSGSDVFAASTKATKTDGGYLINGRKIWTSNAHRSHYCIALLRTSPSTQENRRHGLTQFLIDMKTPGIQVRPIVNISGHHDFNEVIFDDVFVPDDHLLGEKDSAWKQATAELAYERSGPDRWLETFFALNGLVGLAGQTPDDRLAEGLGREVAHITTLRRMSLSVASMLENGHMPATEAAVVKDLGTNWEQANLIRQRLLAPEPTSDVRANDTDFEEILRYATLIAPKLTIQGGTREVLRGIVARGLGLR